MSFKWLCDCSFMSGNCNLNIKKNEGYISYVGDPWTIFTPFFLIIIMNFFIKYKKSYIFNNNKIRN